MAGRLNARFAATVTKPGRHGDGNGLYLLVKPSGAKSWVLRTVVRGRRCDIGLGGYPLVSLAEARAAAFDNRKLARAGGDPLALKRRPDIPTFEDAAQTVIDIHKPTWRDGGKSAGQWSASLRQHAFPRLGTKRVDTITTADVMAVLLPIWTEKAETARRVRQRISAVMRWAVAQGYRADNPAGDTIAAALPKVGETRRHFRALHHTEAGDAIRAVMGSQASLSVRLAFEFLVLTAARSGEVRSASWSEFDMDTATWTIPGERMKGGREHRVPLVGPGAGDPRRGAGARRRKRSGFSSTRRAQAHVRLDAVQAVAGTGYRRSSARLSLHLSGLVFGGRARAPRRSRSVPCPRRERCRRSLCPLRPVGTPPQTDGAVGHASREPCRRQGGSDGAAVEGGRPVSGADVRSDIEREFKEAKRVARAYLRSAGLLPPEGKSKQEHDKEQRWRVERNMRDAILRGSVPGRRAQRSRCVQRRRFGTPVPALTVVTTKSSTLFSKGIALTGRIDWRWIGSCAGCSRRARMCRYGCEYGMKNPGKRKRG